MFLCNYVRYLKDIKFFFYNETLKLFLMQRVEFIRIIIIYILKCSYSNLVHRKSPIRSSRSLNLLIGKSGAFSRVTFFNILFVIAFDCERIQIYSETQRFIYSFILKYKYMSIKLIIIRWLANIFSLCNKKKGQEMQEKIFIH